MYRFLYTDGPIPVAVGDSVDPKVGTVFAAGELIGVVVAEKQQGMISLALKGVAEFPLKSGDTPALGAKIYWSTANGGEVTTTATSNVRIGTCVEANSGKTLITAHKIP